MHGGKIVPEVSGIKDGDVKSTNSKILARRLDKVLYFCMSFLTVATMVIIKALLLISKHSAKV